MKLNVGCGTDYREGFVNVDGSDSFPRIDKVIDLSNDKLTNHFSPDSAEYILANDIVEHFFHWEARDLLEQFYILLKKGCVAEIKMPDAEYIIKSWHIPMEEKLRKLFGGQDISNWKKFKMEESRKKYPFYFCHKYAWTRKRIKRELQSIGYSKITFKQLYTNFVTYAEK